MRVLLLKTLPATAGPDIGLGYLATALRSAGHEVEVGDLEFDDARGKPRTVARRVRDLAPDWVGVKVFDHTVGRGRSYLAEARAAKPDIHTAAGGPHPSGFRARTLESLPEADFAIAGEAERAFPELIAAVRDGGDLGAIPGLVRRTPEGVVVGHQDFPEDLDALGLPAWDLLHPREHVELQMREPWLDRPIPYVPIITTRGCPFPCTFCAAPVTTGKKLRHHSVAFVVDEIEHLRDVYGIETFSIADDAFTNDRRYVDAFCEEIIRRRIRVRWDASSNGIRADTVDEKLARLLDAAGCEKVAFGIESGSERIVQAMGKRFAPDDVERALGILRRESKIRTEGFFIIGYPDERLSDAWQTLKLLSRIDLDTAWLFGFSPHVGTKVSEMLHGHATESIPWGDFANDRVMLGTRHLPRWVVRVYWVLAWMTFYLRPSRAVRFIQHLGPTAVPRALMRLANRVRLVLVPATRPLPPPAPAAA
ncbi:MAG: radical SAM protein [bacterium]